MQSPQDARFTRLEEGNDEPPRQQTETVAELVARTWRSLGSVIWQIPARPVDNVNEEQEQGVAPAPPKEVKGTDHTAEDLARRRLEAPVIGTNKAKCIICTKLVSGTRMSMLPCYHLYCRTCLTDFLERKIAEGDLTPRCFHDVPTRDGSGVQSCGEVMSSSLVECHVSGASWAEYKRVERLRTSAKADDEKVEKKQGCTARQTLAMTPQPRLSLEEIKLKCIICLELVPHSKMKKLTCHHRYCVSCLRDFLEHKISEAQLEPACFFDVPARNGTSGVEPCAEPISKTLIHDIVSEEAWAKFERFAFVKANEFARQCPHCEHSQVCAGPEEPDCVCASCGQTYCFTHSNAHTGTTCAKYERATKRDARRTRGTIVKISKPCPGCKRDVEKIGGCNLMTCSACATKFCWLCCTSFDRTVDRPYEHFKMEWGYVTPCPGQKFKSFTEGRAISGARLRTWQVCHVLLVWPIAFILTAVMTLLTCAWTRLSKRQRASKRECIGWCFSYMAWKVDGMWKAFGLWTMIWCPVAIVVGISSAIHSSCCKKQGNRNRR